MSARTEESELKAILDRGGRAGDRYLNLLQDVCLLAKKRESKSLELLRQAMARLDGLPLGGPSTEFEAIVADRPAGLAGLASEIFDEFVSLARAVRASAGPSPPPIRAEPVRWGAHHHHLSPECASADVGVATELGLERFLRFSEPFERKALLSGRAYLRILWEPPQPDPESAMGVWWRTSGDPVRGVYLVNRLRDLAAACAPHRAVLTSAWSEGLILGEINCMPKNVAFFFRFAAGGSPEAPTWPEDVQKLEFFD